MLHIFLDDIIKINRAEKRQKAKLQAARGAKSTTGLGGPSRGSRGRGRGGVVATSGLRGKSRGGAVRGRGTHIGSARGRGIKQVSSCHTDVEEFQGSGRDIQTF